MHSLNIWNILKDSYKNVFKTWIDKAYDEIKLSSLLNIPCHLLGIKMSVTAGLPQVLIQMQHCLAKS